MSDEGRLNISISKIGKPNLNKGKKLEDIVGKEKAEVIRKKISIKASERIGDKNPMYNKRHTQEAIDKMKVNSPKFHGKDNPNYGRKYKESEKTFDQWEISNIDGRILIINNLNKFCKENNLSSSCMRDIYYGRMKSHKGWISVRKLTDNVKKKDPVK